MMPLTKIDGVATGSAKNESTQKLNFEFNAVPQTPDDDTVAK